MKSYDSMCKDGLFLVIGADPVLDLLFDLVHGFEWAKLLDQILQGPEFLIRSQFRYDYRRVLSFAGVPADDDEFLSRGRSTCSLHLMIWMCLKEK